MTQTRKQSSARPKAPSAPPATPKEAARCCGPIDDLLDAHLFKALADPTRLQLLACLAKCARPCSVSEVAECCSVDLSVVSRHLSALEQAGILGVTRQGRTVFHHVRYTDLAGKLRALADAIDSCCSPSSHRGCCG